MGVPRVGGSKASGRRKSRGGEQAESHEKALRGRLGGSGNLGGCDVSPGYGSSGGRSLSCLWKTRPRVPLRSELSCLMNYTVMEYFLPGITGTPHGEVSHGTVKQPELV